LEAFRHHIPEHIKIRTELERDELPLMADVIRMSEAIAQLVKNAVDAIGTSNGTITVKTEHLHGRDQETGEANEYFSSEDCAALMVADTGGGVEEAIRNRVFEPFFTNRNSCGHIGLGLPLAFLVVKQHNGSILIDSVPGKGTNVKIYLPLSRNDCKRTAVIPLWGCK
jgi:signal transduction histidine kinase